MDYWALIIIMWAGSMDGGVAIEKIEGFTDKTACLAARAQLPDMRSPIGSLKLINTVCVGPLTK